MVEYFSKWEEGAASLHPTMVVEGRLFGEWGEAGRSADRSLVADGLKTSEDRYTLGHAKQHCVVVRFFQTVKLK